jgi:hypothetical protein
MIKLKHAIIGVLISNFCIAYYCNSIIEDLHNEITHLNRLLDDTGTKVSYWNHDGKWKRLTYRDN